MRLILETWRYLEENWQCYSGNSLEHVQIWEFFTRPTLKFPVSLRFITLTSKWPRWRLKSPASRLFTQPFIQMQIKENIKALRHWPLCGEFTGTGEFPAQRASYAENVSIWWRHHVMREMFLLPPLCKCYTDPAWLSRTNERKFVD